MYIQPSLKNWHGRIDSQDDERSHRYHQVIKLLDLRELKQQKDRQTFNLIGFKCDEGVRRNKGRVGAGEAPDAIRQALAKLPWHLTSQAVIADYGDIQCDGKNMEEAQSRLGEAVSKLIQEKSFPIILGGGHETLYGHYLGVRKNIGEDAKLGIINIDAHFDMRPYDVESSSGTMFKQIMDQDQNCAYFCAGVQKQGNTLALFDEADQYNVEYILENELSSNGEFNKIQQFMENNDYIMLTLCTDSISSAFAPGVSAPSPFGLNPRTVRDVINKVVSHRNTLSFDVSEVNPSLDHNGQTVTLAAHLINEALLNFHK
ncbi:formimidoylglutamase [Cytobacillus purgationiresistens]|uniref:Formimidoylglutamase n=1 Tax=Cytobacillus purgationiresistens TaxID=863449 RepID=A0ABU0ANI2_9BACI|nr:formimidoylglutamase [Cytobacillus purgationiresistens]MDQ0272847.1 formiminoglutamase [Cytobacillus purgationiresistens]